MKRWHISGIAAAVALWITYWLDANHDPELWALLFWISAMANFILIALLFDAKEQINSRTA